MDQMTQRMEERVRKEKATRSKVREIMSQKPMFKQMEEYHVHNEMNALKEQKKLLEEKRSLMGPMNPDNITEHLNMYNNLKLENEQLIR